MLYFGYGSLVNRHTRAVAEPFQTASLQGWQRCWAHRAQRPWRDGQADRPGVCALTVQPLADSVIDGVVAKIDDAQIAELDRREAGYRRITLPASDFICETELEEATVSLYLSKAQHHDWACTDYPIIRSYVDCVLAGFRQQFADAGAQRFVQTTTGWDTALYDDRENPLYPRAVTLSADEQQLIERLLEGILPTGRSGS